MPKTIPLVSDLLWVPVSNSRIDTFRISWDRGLVLQLAKESPVFIQDGGYYWFTEACRAKLLAAMDNYGKVEEPKHWKFVEYDSQGDDLWRNNAKCILDLRSRIEALEKGKP